MAKNAASDYPARKKRFVQELTEGKLYPAYLICGEEDYLRTQDARLLLNRLGARDGDMNFTRFSPDGLTAEAVIDTAMTMPFFGPRRVLLIVDSGWFAAKKRRESADGQEEADETDREETSAGNAEGKKLAAYLKEPAETAQLVFVERNINRTTSLFKAVDKSGFVLSCDPPALPDLRRWIAKRFANEGFRIEEQAVDRLLMLTTGGASNAPRTDMNLLVQEMEKLIAYCLGRDAVRLDDINAVCSDILTDSVFMMVDRLTRGDHSGAMALYQDMLSLKIAPQRILALVNRQFNNILQVKELLLENCGQMEIAGRLGIDPYVVKLCSGWSRQYTRERLMEILTLCMERETDIRHGRMKDVIAMEFVIALAGGS